MIGVVIPAHNEAATIAACLASVRVAAASTALGGEQVRIYVAVDRCTDGTADIALAQGADTVEVRGGNVGSARAEGMRAAIAAGAHWLASTDADSIVPSDWLSAQRSCGADAFCGMVMVMDWLDYPHDVSRCFDEAHAHDDDHPHVHGANLGMATAAYLAAGGFQPLPAHEDVLLVDALVACGARIARRAAPAVRTSARRTARTRGGFADYLLALETHLRTATAAPVTGAVHGS